MNNNDNNNNVAVEPTIHRRGLMEVPPIDTHNMVQAHNYHKDVGSMDEFPMGLRVLVVDDDPICLMILEQMLH
jgi:hypothetical protein